MGDALTTQQVAERLSISSSMVRYLVRTGRLTTAFKLPSTRGAMLFDRAEVERYAGVRRQELLDELARLEAVS